MGVKLTDLANTLIEQRVGFGKDFSKPTPLQPTVPGTPTPPDYYALAWDPSTSNYHSLSNNNLWATASANGWAAIRSNTSLQTGKYYFEFTGSQNMMFGLVDETLDTTVGGLRLDQQNSAWVFENRTSGTPGLFMHNGSNINTTYGTYLGAGEQTWGVAVDFDLKKIWLRNSDGSWNGNPVNNTNPAMVFSGNGPWWIVASTFNQTTIAKINTGAQTFVYDVPAGFNAVPPDPAVITLRQQDDNMGFSVAADTTWAVVGSPYQDWDVTGANMLSSAGAVYLYQRAETGWNFVQKLVPPAGHTRQAGDLFGYAVAVKGNRIFVSAPGSKTDAAGANSVTGAGAVFVFDYDTTNSVWAFTQKIVPTGTDARVTNDTFGSSLTVKDDVLVVGAYAADWSYTNAVDTGAAWVFLRDSSTNVWTQIQYIYADGQMRNANDKFAAAVAVDGSWMVVGATGHGYDENEHNFITNAGAAYVFFKDNGVWTLKQKLCSTQRRANDGWGANVAIKGQFITVGHPTSSYLHGVGYGVYTQIGAIWAYKLNGDTWSYLDVIQPTKQHWRDNLQFGGNMTIDGDRVYVALPTDPSDANGSNDLSNAGSVLVFKFNSAGVTKDLSNFKTITSGSGTLTTSANITVRGLAIGSGGTGAAAPSNSLGGGGGSGRVRSGVFNTKNGDTYSWNVAPYVAPGTYGSVNGSASTFGTITADGGTSTPYGGNPGGSGAVGGGGGYSWGNNTNMPNGTSYGRDNLSLFTMNTFTAGTDQGIVSPGKGGGGGGVNMNGVGNYGAGGWGSSTGVPGGGNQGLVYFEYVAQVTTYFPLETKLTGALVNGGRVVNQQFGKSISVADPYMLVGVPGDQYDVDTQNALANAGSALLLQRQADNSWTVVQRFDAGNGMQARNTNDALGASIHSDGTTLVVGATGQSYDLNQRNYKAAAGAVYTWTWNGLSWVFDQKVVPQAADRVAGDNFGAVVQVSGNYMAVSSLKNTTNAAGGSAVTGAGAVWIFEKVAGVWTQKAKIVPTGTNARMANDQFGSVLRLVGSTLAVGAKAHGYDANGANLLASAGAVWLFERDGNGSWNQTTKLVVPTNRAASDNFGVSLDLVDNLLVVGGLNHSYDMDERNSLTQAGAAWVFAKVNGTWTYQQKLSGWGQDRNANDLIGATVAVSGNLLVVGSPGHSYNASGRNWVNSSGAVYAYVWDSGWQFRQKITPTDAQRQTLGRFGLSIAIDGTTMVIGAPGEDWASMAGDTQTNHFGRGAIYVFDRSNGIWSQTTRLTASGTNAHYNNASLPTTSGISYWRQPAFGWAVSLDSNAGVIVAGQPWSCWDSAGANQRFYSGAAYAFVRNPNTGVWAQEARFTADQIIAADRTNYDNFGWSVHTKNSMVIIGSPYQDYDQNGNNLLTDAGAAYVWRRELDGQGGFKWTAETKLTGFSIGRNANDRFGQAMSADGTWLAVGSPGNQFDQDGNNYRSEGGAVYMFQWINQQWTFFQKVVPTGTNARLAGDHFGAAVSVQGSTLVVGAPDQAYDASGANAITSAGAVWTFEYNSEIGWKQIAKLVATGTNGRIANTKFGTTVKVNQDTIVVGVPAHNYDSAGANALTNAGSVWVFTRSGTGLSSTWNVQARLTAPTRAASDQFGYSVDIRDNWLVVGGPYNATDVNNNTTQYSNQNTSTGAVWVFNRVGTTWNFTQKLTGWGHDRNTNDYLGWSMAAHNGTLVVGAPQHDYDADGYNYSAESGAIYVWTWNDVAQTWTFEQKITPTRNYARQAGDKFGQAVTIYDNIICVGVQNHAVDDSGANSLTTSGAVMVFARDPALPIGQRWTQEAKLLPQTRAAGDQFGYAVQLYGNTLVVGAPGNKTDAAGANSVTGSGAIYVFTRSGFSWTQSQKVVPTGTNARQTNDSFGWSVGIYSDVIVVGAPYQDTDETGQVTLTDAGAAWVFRNIGGIWTQQQKLVAEDRARNTNDQFGSAVSGDGTRLAVGAPYHAYDAGFDAATGQLLERNYLSNAGAVYIWNWTGGGWQFEQKLVASNRAAGDLFGSAVCLRADRLVVGAPQHQTDTVGSSALAAAGAAFVFERTGSGQYPWQLVNKLSPVGRQANDQFGYAVTLDGDYIVVGAPGDGSTLPGKAVAFYRNGGVWQQQAIIQSTGTNANQNGDQFGYSVTLKDSILVVGAPQQDYDQDGRVLVSNAGAAWVFTRSGTTWTQSQKLVAWGQDRNSGDRFTYRVDSHNGTMVASAPYHSYDVDGSNYVQNAGAVYTWKWSGSAWTFEQKIVPTGTNARQANDLFGFNLAINGDLLVVTSTAHQYDVDGLNAVVGAGAAWVFERTVGAAGTAVWTQTAKLVATGTNNRNTNDNFGASVVVDDSTKTIIIGSPNHAYGSAVDDPVLANAGAVFVYKKANGVWSQNQKIAAGNIHRTHTVTNGRVAGDNFGYSVAYDSNMLVVGAPNQDFDTIGANSMANAGAAYVFVRASASAQFTQVQKIAGANQAKNSNDKFGYSISGDNTTLAVGVPYHNYDSDNDFYMASAGAVYIWTYNAGAWTMQQKLTPATGNESPERLAGDLFGWNVWLSGDRLVIGAPKHINDTNGTNGVTDAGAVFVYERNTSTNVWSKTAKLVADFRNVGDQFGYVVSQDSATNTIAVGTPYHDWNYDNTQQQTDAGAVWVFVKNGSDWLLQQKITPVFADWKNGDAFGSAVSVSGDILVVGAPKNAYDELVNNQINGAGAVFVYTRVNGVWTKQDKLTALTTMREAGDNFSAELAGEGNWLIVGAPNHTWDQDERNELTDAGAVYVFNWSGSAWTQKQKLTPVGTNARQAGDLFGSTIAINGNWFVVSAPNHKYDADGANQLTSAGAVWVYNLVNGSWTQVQKFAAPSLDRNANDQFGYALDIQGDMFIVGSPKHAYDASGANALTGAGAAWLYKLNSTTNTWAYKQKIVAQTRNTGDAFGSSVTIDGNHAYVGAPTYSQDVSNAGAVFMFTRPGVPSVSLTGGQATTAATIDYVYDINADTISSVTLKTAGAGYKGHPTVAFNPMTDTSKANAFLVPTTLSGITLDNPGYGFDSQPTVTIVPDALDTTGNGATAVAVLSPTSVSTVTLTNFGSGYTDAPNVTITGGGGSGATAKAYLQPTTINNISVVSRGSNYTAIPEVTITGSGNATTVVHMEVDNATIADAGSKFVVGDTLTVNGGLGNAATLQVTAVDAEGAITGVNVLDSGDYTMLPGVAAVTTNRVMASDNYGSISENAATSENYGSITNTADVNEGWGGVANATFNLTYKIHSVVVATSGGYTEQPTVSVPGNAVLDIQLTPTTVASVLITVFGSGYTTEPTVTISGGNGTGAAGYATLRPTYLESINLLTAGSGYTRTPKVVITGDGYGAVATAVLTSTTVASIELVDGGTGYQAWSQRQKLTDYVWDRRKNDHYASALAFSGNNLVVSAPDADKLNDALDAVLDVGAVYAYTKDTSGSRTVYSMFNGYSSWVDGSSVVGNIVSGGRSFTVSQWVRFAQNDNKTTHALFAFARPDATLTLDNVNDVTFHSQTFSYTGSNVSFKVPFDLYGNVRIKLSGAGGGAGGGDGGWGYNGDYKDVTITPLLGETLTLQVGQGGGGGGPGARGYGGYGGWPCGGGGATGGGYDPSRGYPAGGGGGGGHSAVYNQAGTLLTYGGGGKGGQGGNDGWNANVGGNGCNQQWLNNGAAGGAPTRFGSAGNPGTNGYITFEYYTGQPQRQKPVHLVGLYKGRLFYTNLEMDLLSVSNNTVADAQWHNITTTYDRSTSTMKIYVDNVLSLTIPNITVSRDLQASDVFTIGAFWDDKNNNAPPKYFYKGQMTNIGVWNKVLSTAELTTVFNGKPLDVPSNLQASWDATTITNNQWVDGSTFAHTATVNEMFVDADTSTWKNAQKVIPSDVEAGDRFGHAISVFNNTLVATSKLHQLDESGSNRLVGAGAAWVYTKDANNVWSQLQKLVLPANLRAANLDFGTAVSVYNNKMVVGLPGYQNGAGAVALYQLVGGYWNFNTLVVPAALAGNRAGSSVAINNNWLVIGSPNANEVAIYRNNNGVWVYVQTLDGETSGDLFGTTVKLDGETLYVAATNNTTDAVGANSVAGAGAVYVYTNDGFTWSVTQKVVSTNRTNNANWGVSLDATGTRLVVGSSTVGLVEIFENINGVFTYTDIYKQPEIVDQRTAILMHFEGANNSTNFVDEVSGYSTSLTLKSKTHLVNNAAIGAENQLFGASTLALNVAAQTNDYAVINTNNFETRFYDSDLTIEWWERPVETPYGCALMNIGGIDPFANGEGGMVIGLSGNLVRIGTGVNSWDLARDKTLGTPIIGQWQHVAITRYGNNWKTFRNGIEQDTWYQAGSIAISSLPIVLNNYRGNTTWRGNFAGLRITIGYARYSDTFVVPNSMFGVGLSNDTYWNKVSMLMPFSDLNNLVDTPLLFNTTTGIVNNGAYLSTNAAAYGNSSLYLDGGTKSLSVSCGERANISRQNFTIEFSMLPIESGVTSGTHKLIEKSGSWGFYLDRSATTNAGTLRAVVTADTGTFTITGPTVELNQFSHVALVGIGSNVTLFYNGSAQGSTLLTGPVAVNTNAIVFGGQNYKGYIDEFRMITGEAKYVTTFAVPTGEFKFKEMTGTSVGRGSAICAISASEFLVGLPLHMGNNKLSVSATRDTISTTEFNNITVVEGGMFEQWKNTIDGWMAADTHVAPGVEMAQKAGSKFGAKVLARNNQVFIGSPNNGSNMVGARYMTGAGAVHVFTRDSIKSTYKFKMIAIDRRMGAGFGTSIAYSNNRMVITQPDWFINGTGYGRYESYDWSNGTWVNNTSVVGYTGATTATKDVTQQRWGAKATAMNNSLFLFSCPLNNASTTITAGSPWPNIAAGTAYLGSATAFGAAGQGTNYLNAIGTNVLGRQANMLFGSAVSVDSTSGWIVVGAPQDGLDANQLNSSANAGAIYTFQYDGTKARWLLKSKNTSASRTANAGFGSAVHVRGTYLTIGSPGTASVAGRIEVFEAVSGVWTSRYNVAGGTNLTGFSATLLNSGLLAWGTPNFDTSPLTDNGVVGSATRSGTTWTNTNITVEIATNMYGRNAGDQFGYSIAIDKTNGVLAIGAPGHSYNSAGTSIGASAGVVYMFNNVTGDWLYETRITAANTGAGMRMGESLRMRNGLVLFSAPHYNGTNNGYIQLTKRNSANSYTALQNGNYGGTTWNNTYFGKNAVFIDDNLIVISVDGLGVVNNSNASIGNTTACGGWREMKNLNGTWTWSGNPGAYGTINYPVNAAPTQMWQYHNYLPAHTGGRWDQNAMDFTRTYSNGRNANDTFGAAVTISEDKQYIVVGSPYHSYDVNGTLTSTNIGAMFVYWWDAAKGIYRYNDKITNTANAIASTRLGTALEFRGSRLVMGAYLHSTNSNARGLVQSFSYNGTGVTTTWTVELSYQGAQNSGERAGYGVAMLTDSLLVAGLPRYDTNLTDSGVMATWTRTNTTWAALASNLTPVGAVNGRQASDNYGYSVAISGNRIVVGAPKHSYDVNGTASTSAQGSVWSYVYTGTTWRQEAKLLPSNFVTSNQQFGWKVDLKGSTLLVAGVYGSGNDGHVYILNNNGSGWTQTADFHASQSGVSFGQSAAVMSDTLVVAGTPIEDGTNNTSVVDSGAWTYFRQVNGVWKQGLYQVIPPYNGLNPNPTETPGDPAYAYMVPEEKRGYQISNWGGRVKRTATNQRLPDVQVLDFNAQNTMLYTNYSADFSLGNTYAIEGRVRFNAITGDYQHIVGKWQSNLVADYIVALDPSGYFKFYSRALNNWFDMSFLATTGVWYHFAAVRDNTQLRLYINGVLTNSFAVSSAAETNDSRIGLSVGSTWEGVRQLNGQVETVRITKGHYRYNANFDTGLATSTWQSDGSDDAYWNNVMYFISGRSPTTIGMTYGRQNNDTFGASVALVDSKLYVGVPGRSMMTDGSSRPTNNGAVQVFALNATKNKWFYYGGVLNPDSSSTNANFATSIAARQSRLLVGASGTNSNRGAVYMFNEQAGKNWIVERSEQIENYYGGYAVAMADETLGLYSQYTNPGNPSLTNAGSVMAIRYHSLFNTWTSVDSSDGGYGKLNYNASGTYGGNGGGGGGYPGGAGGGLYARTATSVQTFGVVGQGGSGGSSYAPTGTIKAGSGSQPGDTTSSFFSGNGVGGTNGGAGANGRVVVKWYTGTQYKVYDWTGMDQTFVVPVGAYTVEFEMWGAGGSSGQVGTGTGVCAPGAGGGAAYVKATINTTPGEVLTIMVGEGGAAPTGKQPMYLTNYGGGAIGSIGTYFGGMGGGRSAVIRSGVQLIVAAGGGGGAGSGANNSTTPASANGLAGSVGTVTEGGSAVWIHGLSNVRFAGDNLGSAVAIGTNIAYIGSPAHEYNLGGQAIPTDAGVVFVFQRDPNTYTWSLVNKIVAATPTASQKFGSTLVLNGSTLLVGTTTNNGLIEAKKLDGTDYTHLFSVAGSASAQFKLGDLSNITNTIVPFAYDAGRLVVGTPFTTVNSLANGGSWNTYTYSNESLATFATGQTTTGLSYGRFANDHFGTNVAFMDANNLVVSAPDHAHSINGSNSATSRGALYHWTWDPINNVWVYRTKIVEAATANLKLGVGGFYHINKRLLAVGASRTYVYDLGDVDFTAHSNFAQLTNTMAIATDNIVMFGNTTVGSSTTQPTVANAGAVNYVSYSSSWTEDATKLLTVPGLSNGRNASDAFGTSVGLSANWLVVGSPNHSFSATGFARTAGTGALYVFNKNTSTGVYEYNTKVVSSLNTASNIGGWISVNGSLIATGNTGYSSSKGYVEVFERTATAINSINVLQGSANSQQLGSVFAWDGSATIMFGNTTGDGAACNAFGLTNSGDITTYTRSGATWTQGSKVCITGYTNIRNSGDSFGYAMDYNGTYLVVGVPNHDYDVYGNSTSVLNNAGAVMIYAKQPNNTFKVVGKFVSDQRAASNQFGFTVAISPNGQYVAVGEPGANRVKVYSFNGKALTLLSSITPATPNAATDKFGYTVALQNSWLVVGSPKHTYDASDANSLTDAGAAYIYQLNGSQVIFKEKMVAFTLDAAHPTSPTGPHGRNAGDQFGFSVDISDYNDLIVGAPYFDWNTFGEKQIPNAGQIWIRTLR